MENDIKKLHLTDNISIAAAMTVLWAIILFVLSNVVHVSPHATFTVVAVAAGVAVLLALSITSLALVSHLKTNRTALYLEEIQNS